VALGVADMTLAAILALVVIEVHVVDFGIGFELFLERFSFFELGSRVLILLAIDIQLVDLNSFVGGLFLDLLLLQTSVDLGTGGAILIGSELSRTS